MSKLRSVNTQFWSDPWVEDLTPSEKLLYLYFITNEKTNMLGVYELSIKKISFETGIDKKTIEKALKGFERIGKVKYTNNYIVLLNFTKHQNYNTNMKKSAIDIFNNLPDELNESKELIDKQDVNKGFERVRKRLGMVRKIEVEIEIEDEYEGEIEDEEREKPKTVYSQPIFDCYDSCIEFFNDDLIPDTDKKKNNWLDAIEKLNRLDNLKFDDIIVLVQKTRQDEFWSKNFLSLPKLRKKNKEGIIYWKVFYNQFKNNNHAALTKAEQRDIDLANW